MKKEENEKYYKVITKEGYSLNTKINGDGNITALQFGNEKNDLGGPVELVEVTKTEYNKGELHPAVKVLMDYIIAPITNALIENGTDYINHKINTIVVPKAKSKMRELKNNLKIYSRAFIGAISGEELMVYKITREANDTTPIKYDDEQQESNRTTLNLTDEELAQVIETMKINIASLAKCISILARQAADYTDGDDKRYIEISETLMELTSEKVMSNIRLILADNNSGLTDEETKKTLTAFEEGFLLTDNKMIPISKFLVSDKNVTVTNDE